MKKYSPAQSYASIPKVKLVEGFGKGLMEDIKRKTPFLVSDVTDGFSIKVRKVVRSASSKPLQYRFEHVVEQRTTPIWSSFRPDLLR